MFFVCALACAMVFFIFLGSLILIKRKILKSSQKVSLKEIFIAWLGIFIINFLIVQFNIPFAIGIPYRPFVDAGENTYYISLGYIIWVKESKVSEEEPVVEFFVVTKQEKVEIISEEEEKIQVGYSIFGEDLCLGHTQIIPNELPSENERCKICQKEKTKQICSECANTTNRCEICGKLKK